MKARNTFTYQRAPHPSDVINLIIPRQGDKGAIFISGLEGAQRFKSLQKRYISSILTVGTDISDTRFPEGYNHKVIHVLDYPDQDIKAFFEEANQFIESEIGAGRNILIHCYIGISRSVTLTVAFMMSRLDFTLRDSLRHIKNNRPLINPNEGFLKQLFEYSEQLKSQKKTIPRTTILPVFPAKPQEEVHSERQTPKKVMLIAGKALEQQPIVFNRKLGV